MTKHTIGQMPNPSDEPEPSTTPASGESAAGIADEASSPAPCGAPAWVPGQLIIDDRYMVVRAFGEDRYLLRDRQTGEIVEAEIGPASSAPAAAAASMPATAPACPAVTAPVQTPPQAMVPGSTIEGGWLPSEDLDSYVVEGDRSGFVGREFQVVGLPGEGQSAHMFHIRDKATGKKMALKVPKGGPGRVRSQALEFQRGSLQLSFPVASELDVPFGVRDGFLLGLPLATIHAHGYIHGDLHPGNWLYSDLKGRAGVVDADMREMPGRTLSARTAAEDFFSVASTSSEECFHGIVIGYIFACYRILGDRARTYLDELFAELGIRIPHAQIDPGVARREIEAHIARLQTSDRGEVRLADLATCSDDELERCSWLAAALCVTGIESGADAVRAAVEEPHRRPDPRIGVAQMFLSLLRRCESPTQLDSLRLLRDMVQLAPPEQIVRALLDLAHAFTAVAIHRDRCSDPRASFESARAAQWTMLTLQMLPAEMSPYERERHLFAMSVNHHGLCRKAEPPADHGTVVARLAYAQSRSVLHLKLFDDVSRLPGHKFLWSHVWEAQQILLRNLPAALGLPDPERWLFLTKAAIGLMKTSRLLVALAVSTGEARGDAARFEDLWARASPPMLQSSALLAEVLTELHQLLFDSERP